MLIDLGLIVCFSCPLPPPEPPIAYFIGLQDHVLASSCPSEIVLHSEWGGGVSCLCPLRHGQKKAAFAPEGLHVPGAEQVLLMLKV